MKNLNKSTLMLIVIAAAISSCSPYKVLDSWKAENAPAIRENNILVVARTTNLQTRMAFENEITNELKNQGVKATASYLKFPKLGPNTKMTEDRKDSLRTLLANEGFDGAVLSVLKNYEENTREVGFEGGYVESASRLNTSAMGVQAGFYSYYYNPLAYPSDMAYVEKDAFVGIKSRNYVLQTSVFNLKLSEDEQLVAYLNASIENPDNVDQAAKGYAKTLAKKFKKPK